MSTSLILTLAALVPGQPGSSGPELLAIRASRAETITNGALQHAVILIENGEIVLIGEDVPIERGIRTIDLPPDWVVLPGLVNAYTRVGMDGDGYNDSRPSVRASAELYPAAEDYESVIEAGVTTLGQYPAGNGIPGQAVAVRPPAKDGEERTEDLILRDGAYLKVRLRSSGTSKRMLSDGFKKADAWLEKERKNREKWEKAQEKKKKKKKSSSKKKKDSEEKKEEDDEGKKDDKQDEEKDKSTALDDDEKDKKDDKQESDEYVPIDPDPVAQPFLELREGKLRALVGVSKAGDYLHLLDAIGEEEFQWDLRLPVTRECDIFHVKDKIGEAGKRVLIEPSLSLHPGTLRQRNLPAELARAGAKVVLVPRADEVASFATWLNDVGEIVAAGLDREAALRGMTQEPAELLGLGERVGSLEAGKSADLVFMSGDPFEVGSKVEAVMIQGKIVFGEVER